MATKLPPYWSSTSGINIVGNPARILEMQDLVNKTWRVKRTRDRAKGTDLPTGARVLNVLRVENHPNMEIYTQHLAKVKQARKEGCTPFETATGGSIAALDQEFNEMYLFHGTNPVSADAIARTKFLLDKAGSAVGSMFGPGIYLAENASKADEYAKEGEGVFMGQFAFLLNRAIAGSVFTSSEKADHSGQVLSGVYDSVCGDRSAAVGTFREMIFFDEGSVYTEFIILYSRTYDDVSAPSSMIPAAAATATASSAPPAAPSASAPAIAGATPCIKIEGSTVHGDDFAADGLYAVVGETRGEPKYLSGDNVIEVNSNGHWTIRGFTNGGRKVGKCQYHSKTTSHSTPPRNGWRRHDWQNKKDAGPADYVRVFDVAAAPSTMDVTASCEKGCGRARFRSFATCCTHCAGPDGPHARDCISVPQLGGVLEDRLSAAVLICTPTKDDLGPLKAFFHACGGDHWNDKRNWLSDKPLASWQGIQVNEYGNVVQIHLEGNNLTGSLSSAIGELQALERLYLTGNAIQGEVPREIGKCEYLKSLMLNNNDFSGKLPKELLKLQRLEDISTDATGIQDGGKFWAYRGAIKESKLKHSPKDWLNQLNQFKILR